MFFKTHFFDWVKEVCKLDSVTPVLEIMLTSGQVLDVSHIVELKPEHMLVSAFRDGRDCADTFHSYIRYATIYRINVLSQPADERPIGFNVEYRTKIEKPKRTRKKRAPAKTRTAARKKSG